MEGTLLHAAKYKILIGTRLPSEHPLLLHDLRIQGAPNLGGKPAEVR